MVPIFALFGCATSAFLPGQLFATSDNHVNLLSSLSSSSSSSLFSLSSSSSSLTTNTALPFTLVYTHLEINSMIWQIPEANDLSLLIDPIASQLDFGIAPLYRANKKILSEQDTYNLIHEANPTHVLITQGLDDHCHLPTIAKLEEQQQQLLLQQATATSSTRQQQPPGLLQYLICPSALAKVSKVIPMDRITVLRHGQSYRINNKVKVTATVGSLVGPPWQERENGYLLQIHNNDNNNNNNNLPSLIHKKERNNLEEMNENGGLSSLSSSSSLSIYYEPHGDTTPQHLVLNNNKEPIKADICIVPVTKQSIPAQLPTNFQFPLVHGYERIQEIVQFLNASIVIPLCNGDLNTNGILSKLVASTGTIQDFYENQQMNQSNCRKVHVEHPIPGKPLIVRSSQS